MTFHVGQKVVCVDTADRLSNITHHADGTPYQPIDFWLTKGAIYTVRWCGIMADHDLYPPYLGVLLVEINREDDRWLDSPFVASRFRPIVEKKTDISIFTAMLNPNERVAPLVGDRTGVSKKAEVT